MKFARLASFFSLFLVFAALCSSTFLSGCGRGVQSDLELQNARFSVDERGKANFSGSVKNTGNTDYTAVFLVIDAYAGEDFVQQLQMSARIGAGQTLKAGASTSISRSFEDGGLKPDRFEVVRLYGVR